MGEGSSGEACGIGMLNGVAGYTCEVTFEGDGSETRGCASGTLALLRSSTTGSRATR